MNDDQPVSALERTLLAIATSYYRQGDEPALMRARAFEEAAHLVQARDAQIMARIAQWRRYGCVGEAEEIAAILEGRGK